MNLSDVKLYFSNPPGGLIVWQIFIALAAIDFVLVFLHGAALTLMFFRQIAAAPWHLSVFNDDSPAERFNHIKWLLIVVLLVSSWLRLRANALLSFSAIFAIVLADDALRLHERGGQALRDTFSSFSVLGEFAVQAAELLTWMALGLIVIPTAIWGFWHSTEKDRCLSSYMAVGFVAAILSGVVLDTVGEGAKLLSGDRARNIAQNLAGLIECLGESLSASLSLAFAAGIAKFSRCQSIPVAHKN